MTNQNQADGDRRRNSSGNQPEPAPDAWVRDIERRNWAKFQDGLSSAFFGAVGYRRADLSPDDLVIFMANSLNPVSHRILSSLGADTKYAAALADTFVILRHGRPTPAGFTSPLDGLAAAVDLRSEKILSLACFSLSHWVSEILAIARTLPDRLQAMMLAECLVVVECYLSAEGAETEIGENCTEISPSLLLASELRHQLALESLAA